MTEDLHQQQQMEHQKQLLHILVGVWTSVIQGPFTYVLYEDDVFLLASALGLEGELKKMLGVLWRPR